VLAEDKGGNNHCKTWAIHESYPDLALNDCECQGISNTKQCSSWTSLLSTRFRVVHHCNPGGWCMAYLLQFCGLSDPLQLFYLEQRSAAAVVEPEQGPAFAGFRPFQLDDLLAWSLETARRRGWDSEQIQRTVLDVWIDRADVIRQWQARLRVEPSDRLLVAALGSRGDWRQRCEALLHA
jgi:hypothetical protein